LGAFIPMFAAPLIEASLPFPASIRMSPMALVEAGFYGALSALIFTLLPLARTEGIRPAALYRGGAGTRGWPRAPYLVALVVLSVALIGSATWLSGIPELALGAAGGILGALVILSLAALGLRRAARRLARTRATRGRPALRAALAAIGAPRSDATSVILSLGLGLSVLAAVGQIDWNLRSAIATDLPTRAPAFFFVDIQPDQIDGFLDRVSNDPAVTEVESAPMLRGVVNEINGRPAREVVDHWVVRGDRGITYAATPGAKTRITAGTFWPEDYAGDPQISFAAEEAAEMGLKLGDTLTVNILGRDITGTITSFREVDFSNAGIGFIMAMNPSALSGAPHTHIATVYAPPEAEAAILRDITKTYTNVTAIRIREAVDRVAEALGAIATATAWAAGGTLLTGFMVLIGAAAAGERARIYESAILKTLGATRGRILSSFALRSALMGGAAGVVAVAAGGIAGWAVMTFVMDTAYRFEPVSALGIVLGGVLATLLAGLAFALRPLAARPARTLRTQD
ncbi:MAG: ABC transporter permease, partial [Paracoccaceae bacterium]